MEASIIRALLIMAGEFVGGSVRKNVENLALHDLLEKVMAELEAVRAKPNLSERQKEERIVSEETATR